MEPITISGAVDLKIFEYQHKVLYNAINVYGVLGGRYAYLCFFDLIFLTKRDKSPTNPTFLTRDIKKIWNE